MKTPEDIAKLFAGIITTYNFEIERRGYEDHVFREVRNELIAKLDMLDETDIEATREALEIIGLEHSSKLCNIFHGTQNDDEKNKELAQRTSFITAVTMYAHNMDQQAALAHLANMRLSDKNHIGHEIIDNMDGYTQIILRDYFLDYRDIPDARDSLFLSSAMDELHHKKRKETSVVIPLLDASIKQWDKIDKTSELDRSYIATMLAVAINALPDKLDNYFDAEERSKLSASEIITSSLENSAPSEMEAEQLLSIKASIDKLAKEDEIFKYPEKEAWDIFTRMEEAHLAELAQLDTEQTDHNLIDDLGI